MEDYLNTINEIVEFRVQDLLKKKLQSLSVTVEIQGRKVDIDNISVEDEEVFVEIWSPIYCDGTKEYVDFKWRK